MVFQTSPMAAESPGAIKLLNGKSFAPYQIQTECNRPTDEEGQDTKQFDSADVGRKELGPSKGPLLDSSQMADAGDHAKLNSGALACQVCDRTFTSQHRCEGHFRTELHRKRLALAAQTGKEFQAKKKTFQCKIGPTTITTLDPSDIEGLHLLVATTIAAPVEAVDVASFMYKFFKNGRTVGSGLPLKDDNGLNHFRTHIKSVNIALKAGEMIHFELHLARPAVKKVQYSVDDDSILGMRVEPINDLSKLIHGKKTLDEKLEPLRIHMFQLYNPGGKFHCGDAKHTEACARDDSSGRHFILGKNQQDTLVFSVLHWGTLPIGKSAFRPDKSRGFHQPPQPAAGPSTSVAPSTPNNDLLMQMLLLQQQSGQAAQQQQQFMIQTLMSVMGAQRSPFPGAFGGFPQTALFANTQNASAPMTPFANPHNGAGQMMPFMNIQNASAPSASSFPASPFSNTPYPDMDASGAGGPPAM
ncbi:hypothetical protein R3P38DRAFT_3243692 [Favolaschia claudopus]|uniref:C2H2-type domain-containing protein n=1 Tax=Favolaschia claudopus TaxID=2862362 RepID=A0AAV9Z2U9_9AGAR